MIKRYIMAALLLLLLTGCAKEPCTAHTDQNSDDLCDVCGRSVIIVIDFYCVNDLHGRVLDSAAQPGIDEMTTYFEQVKQTDDNVILLSAGDMWQGSAESNLTRGQLLVEWMNILDFQGMALGNHEFDWGEAHIEQNAKTAQFPFLAINVFDADTKERVSYCEPSRMVEVDGVQIGLIGAAGDNYSSIAPDMTKGIYFVTDAALTQLVKEESQRLREQGADFIVYILHDGYGGSPAGNALPVKQQQLASYYDVALSDGYVDLVFEGHTHQRYVLVDEYGVYHLQNGGDNTGGMSHVEISLHAIRGTVNVRQVELVRNEQYAALEGSATLDGILERYQDTLAPALSPCGKLAHAIPGDDLRQIIADLYYLEGLTRWGSEYDIAMGGGFISIRQPGYLTGGEVTYGDLLELFPFDNELVLCTISGRDLKNRFIESDNKNYFMCFDEDLTRDLDENATYYVVVDSYSSTYAPNRLTEVERYGESYYARDMLANYIRNGGLN